MAYIGLQPQQKTVATSTQQLTGNGVDHEFALDRAVSKAADLIVFVGSSVQIPEVDYTAQNKTILFVTEPASSGTPNINITYVAGALATLNVNANAFPIGTSVEPSVRSADAASTGIYWPSTTTLGFTVSGNTRVTVTDNPTTTSPTTGALIVNGGVGIAQALHVAGDTHIQSTTQSTNTTTGALIVSGGVGIAKDIFVGGSLDVSGAFTVAGAFNTTSSDSLIIDTPFVFLANNNLGDSLDTGFTSTYNDGTQRYTGLFRDITDGDYKLFDNLTVQPTTVVDTANVSFNYANLIVGNITADNIFGTIAGGTSITTVGNLANLSVQTTITSYGINYLYSTQAASSTTTGALQVKGGAGVVGNLYAGNVQGTTLTGTLLTASQPSITAVGTLTNGTLGSGFTTVATTVGGTGLTSFTLNGAVYASSTSALTTGTLPIASGGTGSTSTTYCSLTTNVTGTLPVANGGTGITSFGTGVATFLGTPSSANLLAAVTDETGTGALVFGTSPTFTTQITTPAIAKSGTNGVGDIGGVGSTFATVYATTFSGVSTTAKYADLAENYSADAAYEPGTVLHFGGEFEVSQCDADMCSRVAGVVSTAPAHLMNTSLTGDNVVALALQGRVPCKVQGTVRKGDMMVSAGNGQARAEANPRVGSVIGKALEDFDGAEGVIEVVVGRV
jgi:hypothetical protein